VGGEDALTTPGKDISDFTQVRIALPTKKKNENTKEDSKRNLSTGKERPGFHHHQAMNHFSSAEKGRRKKKGYRKGR